MGNFYTNFALLGPTQTDVAEWFQDKHRAAYVAPSSRGFVIAYDAECESQDLVEIETVGLQLSADLECPVMSVLNHDDDLLILRLFSKGKLRAKRDSFLDGIMSGFQIAIHFRQPPIAPFASLLLTVLWFLFEFIRHSLLAKLLALPSWSVGSGYEYISRGEPPEGLKMEQLVKV